MSVFQPGPEIIFQYFPDLTDKQKQQFTDLGPLYEDWNSKINLISRKELGNLYERHVLHSLAIAKLFEFEAGDQVMDLGTGGGFPGIPLAILFPETHFQLVDSIGKKIKVVNDIAEKLGLTNVTARLDRAEKIKGKLDYVVTRGVAEINQVKHWVGNKIKKTTNWKSPKGIVFLKGGDLTQELNDSGQSCLVRNLSDWYQEPFFETKRLVFLEI